MAADNSSRPWRDIARELARETNPTRTFELAQELTKAMDEQDAHNPKTSDAVFLGNYGSAPSR